MWIIFCNSLNSGIFPNNLKRSNIVPVYKNDCKYLIQNYRPVSLQPISSKIFERLIFNSLYNNLFCFNQFCSNSCVNQIYESFENFLSLETCSKFFDMPKAFDRVWDEGFMYKLKTIDCVSDNILTLFQSFLSQKYQRILLDHQNSHWELIKTCCKGLF